MQTDKLKKEIKIVNLLLQNTYILETGEIGLENVKHYVRS